MKDLLKRVLPEPIQRAIYRFLWNPVRDAYWGFLKLECVLPSGLRVEVRNRSDWTICSEVLISGEYDVPIEHALSHRTPGRTFNVADLGGNVGYFTFCCADRFFRQNSEAGSLRIKLIEGSPAVFRDLQGRVAAEPLLRDCVTLRLGLVGRNAGEAFIGGSHIHYSNMVSEKPMPGAARVSFVDLDEEFREVDRIDLLKCDIEGAEFDFIEHFQGFLGKVDAAVFEFHRYGRNLDDARRTLHACGFHNRQVLRDTPAYAIEFYWR